MTKKDKIRILILLILWLSAFAPIYPELIRDCLAHSDNSHAFLVPLIAAFFVWRKKKELQSAKIDGSAWGALILAISLITYLLSYVGGLAFPSRVAMVTSLFGLIWLCLGGGFIRILAFPILFLLFMVPVPYSLISLVSMPLQLIATRTSATLIKHCAIPVYREGNMLYFVQTQLEVAEACSGIRSIMSLTMLSLVFCYLSRKGWWRKAILVAVAIPIAMMANIVRVTGTGILAHFYGDKAARGFLHEFSGVAVFIFGFMVLYTVFHFLNSIRPDNVD